MNHQAPPVRSGFNFNRLPIEETATVLRELSHSLLDAALDHAEEPDLNCLLDLRPTRFHKSGRMGPLTLYDRFRLGTLAFRRGLARLLGKDRQKSGYLQMLAKYDALVNRGGGRLSPGVRRRLLSDILVENLSDPRPQFLPEDFWQLAGDLAWQDLQFQYEAGRRVARFLRTQVVFNQGEIPRPLFSARVFWALLVLARPQRRRWGKKRKIAVAMTRLAREGRRLIAAGGWAGFWDQWLICEYLRGHPQAISGHDAVFEAALRALPLLTEARLELTLEGNWSQAPHQQGLMAAANWREQMPSWMPAWYLTFEADEPTRPRGGWLRRLFGFLRRDGKGANIPAEPF